MLLGLPLLLALPSACDRAPAEPSSPAPMVARPNTSALPSAPAGQVSTARERQPLRAQGSSRQVQAARCVQPLLTEPPRSVTSRSSCPADPDGRPSMPRGTVSFKDAPTAPQLRVELALHFEHQRHGLMFRSQLADDEGMLFSYSDEDIRRFWMHNTCLALDMIHIDKDQYIVGIVENVPPWNDTTRAIECPAQHVLEVPAGWSRRYGVQPGQRVEFSLAAQN